MTIWVVRHGCAGRREDWSGDDRRRPLDAVGRRQADAIADVLIPRRPRRLRSSPAARCMDTLALLAARLDLPVIEDEDLLPDRYPGGLLALGEAADPGDVLCTHGELMRPAAEELRRRRALAPGADEHLTAKGVVWELTSSPLSVRVFPPGPCSIHPS